MGVCEDETELMILWIVGRSVTYRERDSHSNVMSPVRMQGIPIQGCGSTIQYHPIAQPEGTVPGVSVKLVRRWNGSLEK